MKIRNTDGDIFDLSIIGYQYPNNKNDYWDSNWLIIGIDVIQRGKKWSAVQPCMTAFEVLGLATWLESVHAGVTRKIDYSFTEPNLAFQVGEKDGGRYLRIFFELEFRPAWAHSETAFARDLWIDFDLATIDLLKISQELLFQLRNHPQRVFK